MDDHDWAAEWNAVCKETTELVAAQKSNWRQGWDRRPLRVPVRAPQQDKEYDLCDDDIVPLTGLPDFDVARVPLASWWNSRLVISHRNYVALATDYVLHSYGRQKDLFQQLHQEILEAAAWLQTSPQHRVVDRGDKGDIGAVELVMVAVYCNICEHRATPARGTQGPVPAPVLHDVLSALGGRDRRAAGFVCAAWRRAACDALLPIGEDDVRAWIGPCLREMRQAASLVYLRVGPVRMLWMFTRRWLRGCR
jgi:hypothetical protein